MFGIRDFATLGPHTLARSLRWLLLGGCEPRLGVVDELGLSSGNQTELLQPEESGEPPSPPSGSTSTSWASSVWWGEWKIRFLLGWKTFTAGGGRLCTNGGVISLPDRPVWVVVLRALLASGWMDRPQPLSPGLLDGNSLGA